MVQSQILHPINNVLFGILYYIAGDRQTSNHFGIRLQFGNGFVGTGKSAAAVSVKGDDLLARKIIGIEKGVQDHRQISPPVGIADKHGIIFIKVLNAVLDRRTGILAFLLLGILYQRIVIGGIRHFGFNAEDVRTGVFFDYIRHVLGIAKSFAAYYNRTVVLIVRHGKVNNKRFACIC